MLLSQATKLWDVDTEIHLPGMLLSPLASRTLGTSLSSEGEGRFDQQLTFQALREATRCVSSQQLQWLAGEMRCGNILCPH